MDPLQRGPALARPAVDDDPDVAWTPPEGARPPEVSVRVEPPAWSRPAAPTPWAAPAAGGRATALPSPPAWAAPAVAELGQLMRRLSGEDVRPGPEYPPLRSGVRTHSPFR